MIQRLKHTLLKRDKKNAGKSKFKAFSIYITKTKKLIKNRLFNSASKYKSKLYIRRKDNIYTLSKSLLIRIEKK